MKLLVVAVAVLAIAPAAFAGPSLRVGAVEDAAIWSDPGRYKVEMRAADAAGNVGRKSITIAAAHKRRGEASTPSGWLFTRARPTRAR
jgi:hypothetical protein